jgi:hypothetical protein
MDRGKRSGGYAALEDYDGYEFVFENGYYARVAFRRNEAEGAAHPYRYSLTLHELGVDTAQVDVRKR